MARRLADADLLTVIPAKAGIRAGRHPVRIRIYGIIGFSGFPPARVFGLAVFPVMLKAQVARSGIRMASVHAPVHQQSIPHRRRDEGARAQAGFESGQSLHREIRTIFRRAKPFPAPYAIWRRSRTPPFATIAASVCREMPRLRYAESARERVPLRLRQSDSRAASRRAPVQPAAAVRARPMSALLQDERARLRVLLLMRATPRRTAAESGRRRILLRALQAEPRAVWRRRLLRERERRGAGGVWD